VSIEAAIALSKDGPRIKILVRANGGPNFSQRGVIASFTAILFNGFSPQKRGAQESQIFPGEAMALLARPWHLAQKQSIFCVI